MQNKLSDLNNYLFAQIERLDDDELSNEPDKLRAEIERTNAICKRKHHKKHGRCG